MKLSMFRPLFSQKNEKKKLNFFFEFQKMKKKLKKKNLKKKNSIKKNFFFIDFFFFFEDCAFRFKMYVSVIKIHGMRAQYCNFLASFCVVFCVFLKLKRLN